MGKSSINGPFSMAMLNNQRVILTGLRWFKMVFWCFDVQPPRNQVLLRLAFVMRCNKWPRCYVVDWSCDAMGPDLFEGFPYSLKKGRDEAFTQNEL